MEIIHEIIKQQHPPQHLENSPRTTVGLPFSRADITWLFHPISAGFQPIMVGQKPIFVPAINNVATFIYICCC
jgi:hypothetical protein